jgi:hypothetical protein
VMLEQTPAGLVGSFSYKKDLFKPNIIKRWVADYTTILTRAVVNPETPLGRLGSRK